MTETERERGWQLVSLEEERGKHLADGSDVKVKVKVGYLL